MYTMYADPKGAALAEKAKKERDESACHLIHDAGGVPLRF